MLELVTANIGVRVRRVTKNGREYFVAPMSMVVPGVLAGSQGPLYYPPDELKAAAKSWDGMPMVVYHPTDDRGNHISADTSGVIAKQGIGEVRNPSFNKGKLRAEGWFDVEKTRKVDNRVYKALKTLTPIELSTGLFTENDLANSGANYRGRGYTAVARNHKPDHLAILPDQVGACSIKDGCGVLVNQSSVSVNVWSDEARMASAEARRGKSVEDRAKEHVAQHAHKYTPEQHAAMAAAHEQAARLAAKAAKDESKPGSEQNKRDSQMYAAESKAHAALAKAHREHAAVGNGVASTNKGYPWDKCIADAEKEYGDKETAKKVCGKIKAENSRSVIVGSFNAGSLPKGAWIEDKPCKCGKSGGECECKKPASNAGGLPSEEADVSPEKACKILKDGTIRGHELTEAQRGMFGAICGKRGKTNNSVLINDKDEHGYGSYPRSGKESQGKPKQKSDQSREGIDAVISRHDPLGLGHATGYREGKAFKPEPELPNRLGIKATREDPLGLGYSTGYGKKQGKTVNSMSVNAWSDEARRVSAEVRSHGFKSVGSEHTAGAHKTWFEHSSMSPKEAIRKLGLKKTDYGSFSEHSRSSDTHELKLLGRDDTDTGKTTVLLTRYKKGEAGMTHRSGIENQDRAAVYRQGKEQSATANVWSDEARQASIEARRKGGGKSPKAASAHAAEKTKAAFGTRSRSAHAEAAQAHIAASKAHHDAADRSFAKGHLEQASHHRFEADRHNRAAVYHQDEEQAATANILKTKQAVNKRSKPMGDNPNREELVDDLITNCACWDEEDRETLNSFSDEKLTALKRAADREGYAAEIVSGVTAGFQDPTGNMHRFNARTGQWETKLASNAKKDKAKAADDEEDAEDMGADEEAEGEPKKPARNAVENYDLTFEEWLNSGPQPYQDMVNNMQKLEQREKARIVAQLTANVPDSERRIHQDRLMRRPLEDLQNDLALMGPSVNAEEEDAAPARSIAGKVGGGSVRNIIADKEDYLPLPTMNFKKGAKTGVSHAVSNFSGVAGAGDVSSAVDEEAWMAHAPAPIRNQWTQMKTMMDRERKRLIEQITSNIADNDARRRLAEQLSGMDVEQIRAFTALNPPKRGTANYVGASGGPATNRSVFLDEDKNDYLPLPTANWKKWRDEEGNGGKVRNRHSSAAS